MYLGRIRLWYNATYFHGNALGMRRVGTSLQTATAYPTDTPFFYLKIVWGTSVLCATSEAGTWQTCLTSQNSSGTRSVVSVDFLLWTGLNTGAERAWLELSCLWTHLSLAPDFRKMGVCKMRWLCVMWNLVWKELTTGASLKPGWSLGTNNPRARVFQLEESAALIITVWDYSQETQWVSQWFPSGKFTLHCQRGSATQVRGDQQRLNTAGQVLHFQWHAMK